MSMKDEKDYIVQTEVKKILEHLDSCKVKYMGETYGEIIRLVGFHCMVRFEVFREAESELAKLDAEQIKATIPIEIKKKPKKNKKGRK
jgi:hypothetical protein